MGTLERRVLTCGCVRCVTSCAAGERFRRARMRERGAADEEERQDGEREEEEGNGEEGRKGADEKGWGRR